MEPVMGSLEMIVGEESRGMTVQAATPEAVPVIVEAVYGVQDVTEDDVVGGAVAAWRAKTAMGETARIILWPEVETPEPRPQPEEQDDV